MLNRTFEQCKLAIFAASIFKVHAQEVVSKLV